MKIAIIGSFFTEIPLKPGSIHAPLTLSYNLAKKLATMGHIVTYFGSYNKDIPKKKNLSFFDFKRSVVPTELISNKDYVSSQLLVEYEQGYFSQVLDKSSDFDLIYSWYATLIAPLSRQTVKPIVATHHDSTNIKRSLIIFEACNAKNFFIIPISKHMESIMPYKNNLSPVYNGVNVCDIPENNPRDFFSWVGRVTPSKGLHVAIDLAKKLNFKLKIVGPMKESFADFGNVSQYVTTVQNEIKRNSNIEYLGELSHKETLEIISQSKGLIFPSSGVEACPMVPIESAVAGTPVITTDKGPLPEIIEDQITGFLSKNQREMEEAIEKIATIDRKKCRDCAISRFSSDVMADNYLQQFEKAIKLNKRNNNV